MEGVRSVDAWLERLDEQRDDHAALHRHDREAELPAPLTHRMAGLAGHLLRVDAGRSGVDRRTEALTSFYPGYRYGHTTGTKMQRLMGELSAEGEEGRHCLYEYTISSDLLSLAARLRTPRSGVSSTSWRSIRSSWRNGAS